MKVKVILSGFILLLLLFSSLYKPDDGNSNWQVYGGDNESTRYSSLSQINKNNVQNLKIAWKFSAGEIDTSNRTQIQCNPLIIDGILFGATPEKKIFALNAETGKRIWIFNPFDQITSQNRSESWGGIIRGLSYWKDKDDERILVSTGSYFFALNAKDGKPIKTFGDNGKIDLHDDLDKNVEGAFIVCNTPGVVYKNLIIIGTRVSEEADAAPGHIRAYNILTGKREWIFHTIPHPGEAGFNTWEDSLSYQKIGGANSWAGMSLDEKRGIVYVPTGSASFDFYGGNRKGSNLFSNCIIALNAATGKRIWHYQTIHHDIWDKDLPANPNLVTITKDGKKIDCVAQITKTGFVFLLNRDNGEPIYPINEVPVPSSDIIGESTWKTQPIPTFPKPFTRQTFNEEDLNDLISPEEKNILKQRLKSYKTGNMFNPPSKQGTVIFPGYDGGAEWGGAAFDPTTELLYVNSNEMPWVLTLVDVDSKKTEHENMFTAGKRLYNNTCATCHGMDRKGDAQHIFPSLVNLKSKYKKEQVSEIIRKGRRMMPSFNQVSEVDRNAILTYIMELDDKMKGKEYSPSSVINAPILPYNSTGYHRFITKDGYPAIKPPWGTLNAINLKTGEIEWKIPFGEIEKLKNKGIPTTGTENYGGPVVTAGGLLFIAATKDEKFRVFDKDNGKILFEIKLPAAGFATPSVYSVKGKQYVVIACGGGKIGTKSGDSYVAFSLP